MKERLKAAWYLIFVFSIIFTGCTPQEQSSPLKEDLQAVVEPQTTEDNLNSTDDTIPLQIHVIDVGQAEAIFIEQGTHQMLIDAGNNADGELVNTYLSQQGVENLEYVIGTHPHEDHIGGLDDVLEHFPVDTIMMPRVITATKTFEDVIGAIAKTNQKITVPVVGNTYSLGDAKWTILAPQHDTYEDLNNYSIVIRLVYGEQAFLLTGDAEVESEGEMLSYCQQNNLSLHADLLKVGHHGSATSTSDAFIATVNPLVAVISCGEDNDYGHPHQEVINKLQAKDITIYRTDEMGSIIVRSDGHALTITTPEVSINDEHGIVISDLDKQAEIITITNYSNQTVDLSGWKIVSVRGQETYCFANYQLDAFASVKVASGEATGDLLWEKGYVWNNNKPDPAELYDASGSLVYKFE